MSLNNFNSNQSNKLRVKRSSLASQDIPTWFVFCYYMNSELFKKKFLKYGVIINNEDDLATLVRLSLSGGDKKGEIKSENGTPIVFDALKIINEIELSTDEIQRGLRDKFIIED